MKHYKAKLEAMLDGVEEVLKKSLMPDVIKANDALDPTTEMNSILTKTFEKSKEVHKKLHDSGLLTENKTENIFILEQLIRGYKEAELDGAAAKPMAYEEAEGKLAAAFSFLLGSGFDEKQATSAINKIMDKSLTSIKSDIDAVNKIRGIIKANPDTQLLLKEFMADMEAKVPKKQKSRALSVKKANSDRPLRTRSKRAFDSSQLVLMVSSSEGEFIDGIGFPKEGKIENPKIYASVKQFLKDGEIETARSNNAKGQHFVKVTEDYEIRVLEAAEFESRQTLRICFKNRHGETTNMVTWKNAYGRAPTPLRDALDHEEIIDATIMAKSGKVYTAERDGEKVEIMSMYSFENNLTGSPQ